MKYIIKFTAMKVRGTKKVKRKGQRKRRLDEMKVRGIINARKSNESQRNNNVLSNEGQINNESQKNNHPIQPFLPAPVLLPCCVRTRGEFPKL